MILPYANTNADPHQNMFLSSTLNKTIMSMVREGDYQHPGEEEAIEIVFQQVERDPGQYLLDVGCGYGGTADYIQKRKFGKVIGIDINYDVVNTATLKYGESQLNLITNPELLSDKPFFFHCDVLTIANYFKENFHISIVFDLIYSFSAFFLFNSHINALNELAKIAKEGTELLIFDYVDYGEYAHNPYLENQKLLLPNMISYNDISLLFNSTPWAINYCKRIDNDYAKWYSEVVAKIECKKNTIVELYGEAVFDCFMRRYQHILTALKQKVIGGIIISAKLMSISLS